MKINLWKLCSVASALIIGAVAACPLIDYALKTGFPEKLYIIDMKFTGVPVDSFMCTQSTNRFGLDNLSDFEPPVQKQKNCAILALGSPQPDGSFNAVRSPALVMNRLFRSEGTIHLKAERIEAIKPI